MTYESVANRLRDRIIAMIPEHPEVLTIENAFDLFKVGLKCGDLEPSLAQAQWALSAAKQQWKDRTVD